MQNFPQSHPLFDGIDGPDLRRLIVCLDAGAHAYERGEYVLRAGDPCAWVGIVCAGSAHVVQEDFWGNRSLLARLGPGDLFGEAFACAGVASLPVSVVAAGRCDVRLLRADKLCAPCPAVCPGHARLMQNLLALLAQKNVSLTRKISHLTRRGTREKVLSYLSEQARLAGNAQFDIPFTRQELADYLSVDRSALSAVLCALRDEGALQFQRHRFHLLRRDGHA